MSKYDELLNKSWDEIPEVQLLPVGSWKLKCRGAKFQDAKQEDQSPQIAFTYEAVEPMADVDDDELAKLGDDYNFADNLIFHRFWFGSGADRQMVRNHITKHGIDPNDYSVSDSLKAVKGKEIIAVVALDTYKDRAGEMRTQNILKAFVAVE